MLRQHLRNAFDFLAAPSPSYPDRLAPACVHNHQRSATFALAAVIAGAYCLLISRYWHYSTDSALYLTLARNLAEGHGYVFSGIPHRQVPAGWPCSAGCPIWSFCWDAVGPPAGARYW